MFCVDCRYHKNSDWGVHMCTHQKDGIKISLVTGDVITEIYGCGDERESSCINYCGTIGRFFEKKPRFWQRCFHEV